MRYTCKIFGISSLIGLVPSVASPQDVTHAGIPDIRSYILSIPTPSDAAAQRESTSVSTRVMENGTLMLVTRTKYRITETPDEIVAFQPNSGVIWPGALIQGNSIEGGTPALISLPRGPATITLNAGGLARSATVPNATFSDVAGAHAQLLNEVLSTNPTVPASISFQKVEQHSLQQAMLALGFSASWLSGGVKATLGVSSGTNTHSVLVKFVQVYYTLTYSSPQYPEQVFAPSVSLDDLKRSGVIGQLNPPAYVSSITYGRMLLYKVTSTASYDSLEMAISVAHRATAIPISAEARGRFQQIMDNSQIQLVAIGGNPGQAIQLGSGREIVGYLQSGANLTSTSVGFPIAYSVRYLSNNRLARFGYTLQYDVEKHTPVQRELTLHLDRIRIFRDCDEPPRGKGEFFWTFLLNGDTVAVRYRHDAASAGDRQDIIINTDKQIPLTMEPSSSFTIYGIVREMDNVFHDLVGQFRHRYQFSDQGWNLGVHRADLGRGDCRASVYYRTDVSPLATIAP
jgi:thiol-activated cytolysin